jgi:hypothetical protein
MIMRPNLEVVTVRSCSGAYVSGIEYSDAKTNLLSWLVTESVKYQI